MQAFSELDLPNSELWFIGETTGLRNLKPIASHFDHPNIHFKGTFPQCELPNLYSQCTIACLMSISDGFGMVIPQAMACELPVIVSNQVGASDIVTDGNDGFIVPSQDVDALKARILLLYEQPELCTELGRTARKTASLNSWNAYGDRLASFLKRDEKEEYGSNLLLSS